MLQHQESSIQFERDRLLCVNYVVLNELCKLAMMTTRLLRDVPKSVVVHAMCMHLEFLNNINFYHMSRDSIRLRPVHLHPNCSSTIRLDSIRRGSIFPNGPAGHKLFLGESLCKHSQGFDRKGKLVVGV
jgi:hypothetical protein